MQPMAAKVILLVSPRQVYSLCSLTVHYESPELVIVGEVLAGALILGSKPQLRAHVREPRIAYATVQNFRSARATCWPGNVSCFTYCKKGWLEGSVNSTLLHPWCLF